MKSSENSKLKKQFLEFSLKYESKENLKHVKSELSENENYELKKVKNLFNKIN